MTDRPIFHVMEFAGRGDAFFGGDAADWGLRRVGDGYQFMSAFDALLKKAPTAYFPTKDEAEAAAAASSTRNGLISAMEKRIDPKIPTGQIEWFVQHLHVGATDDEVSSEIVARLTKACDGDADILGQAGAFALACHRANQDLVTKFRL
ncbi:hypothetical protein D3C71_538750 [compost metagenome]